MKKTIALLLSALLCLSVVPTYALEQNGDTAQIQSGKKDLETVRLSDSAVSDALKKTAEKVQELINSLPALDEVKNMTNEEQQSAYMEIQKAYEAYEALTEEEKTKITGAEVFPVLLAFFTEGVSPLGGNAFTVATEDDTKYQYDGGVLNVEDGADIKVSTNGVTTTDCIVVSGTATITLNRVNIDCSNSRCPAIKVSRGAKLTLVLPYNDEIPITNQLIGGEQGICVDSRAELIIKCEKHNNPGVDRCNDKCGYLDVRGGHDKEGIGGSYNTSADAGKITITGGRVVTSGISGPPGIGSHGTYAGGNVTISGGYVVANGTGGVGIGGGASAGSFSTGENGNAVIITDGIHDHSKEEEWSGVIFDGKNGKVYGKTVTTEVSFLISDNCTLTIPDDTILTIHKDATLINYGKIQTESTGQLIVEGKYTDVMGELLIEPNNGKFGLCEYDDTQRVITVKDGADITVSMRDSRPDAFAYDRIVVEGNAKAKITLNGVNINRSNSDNPAIEVRSGAVLTLVLPNNRKNEFIGGQNNGAGISVPDGAALNIVCDTHSNGNGSCNDNCGSLKATGGDSCAGIGGENGAGGKITISGGVVTATGGDGGAGIGGGYGAGGEVTISGGVVSAKGGYFAAGIGGGYDGLGEKVTISGGVVNATGGSDGAGIGGGENGAGGDVTISGGVVSATGGQKAAGIGGGRKGAGGTFSTGTTGNAVIFTNSISDHSEESIWSGVIFEGTNGKVYGTTVAPKVSFEVSNGSTLTIPQDTTLVIPEGVTLTNNGTIAGDGSLICIGECKGNGTINDFPKKSKITLKFDKEKYQYNDTATITAKISPDTTRTSTASARADVPENKIVFYVENSRGKKQFDEKVIDSTTKEFKIQLSADNGFVPGNNIISAEYGGNQIGFDSSTSNSISINIQESNPSDDTAGDAANPFINGNVFFPYAPPVSTSNSNTITPNAVTTGDQSAENVNAFEFADDNEEASATYGESNNPAESGGEQNSDAETNAVINKNDSDLPPKTGNGGSVTIIALALVSLVGIGGISLYNKKKKR